MATRQVTQPHDLSGLSTFGLPATAAEIFRLKSVDQLTDPRLLAADLLILGEGSNTVFLTDWPGTVVLNQITGCEATEMDGSVLVKVGAGESWHGFVRHCLKQGWYGLENLVMIPGSVGAAPIQNIGAYGVELAEFVESVIAWNRLDQRFEHFDKAQCQFGYRDSVFKHTTPSQYLITHVVFRLSRTFQPNTDYASLKEALKKRHLDRSCTPEQLAATVMRLRRHRLPDPARINNVGSFFKNPLISAEQHQQLKTSWPALPSWSVPGSVSGSKEGMHFKISAAWMIEQAGLKGHRIGDAAVYDRHALVLVNLGQATAKDLEALIALITEKVWKKFGVRLEPEPQIIKAS